LGPRRYQRLTLVAPVAALALSACAGAWGRDELARAPAWFKERQKELAGQGYPDLASVPQSTVSAAEAARWAATEQELRAAGAAIEASPRGQPAPPADDDADAFDKAAREAIDSARPGASAPAAEPARPQ
jgi:hypothetical protein